MRSCPARRILTDNPTALRRKMRSDTEILEEAAKTGNLDRSQWSSLLERLLSRLDEIVYNEFPKPAIIINAPPPPSLHSQARPTQGEEGGSSQGSTQSTNKENAPPSSPSALVDQCAASVENGLDEAAETTATLVEPPPDTLPPQFLSQLSTIKNTLTSTFSNSPPYTIQRLSELILRPKSHYRSLGAYLRAVDRVVSVSSSTDVFPLAKAALPSDGAPPLLNGTGPLLPAPDVSAALGSDESLGGALLTPIPWLRADHVAHVNTESMDIIDGPDGAGSVQTVSVSLNGRVSTSQQGESMRDVGGITQGELLRKEQEAGVVPVTQTPTGPRAQTSAASTGRGPSQEEGAEEEEHSHARGPEEIGMQDMGPQEPAGARKFDVEAAVGRSAPKEGSPSKDEAMSDDAEKETEEPKTEAGSGDGDVVLTDADGKTEKEAEQSEVPGAEEGPDAVDTTAQ